MHLSAAIQGYWLARKRDLSPDTVTDYRLSFRRLVDYLADPPFADITADDPLTLQRILGHQSMATVQIYVKLADVDIERSQVAASPADNWRL